MDATGFLVGFFAGLLFMTLAMAAAYSFLKGSRSKRTEIKGYLDLIPDLTERQRSKVQDIRRDFLPRVEAIRQSMQTWRMELAQLLFEEPSDRAAIYAVSEKILRHQAELEREVIEHILEEKDLLSPSQKRKFFEIIVEQFSAGGLGVHDIRRGR